MPSDEMVEKARAAWRSFATKTMPDWHKHAMRAALAAAEAGKPVGYAVWYFDNEQPALHYGKPGPSAAITRVAPLFASPPSEASRDERAVPVTPTNRTIVGGFLNDGDGWGVTVDASPTVDERAAIRKEAFEEAADMAEDWASERGDGFMSLATAIRARGA